MFRSFSYRFHSFWENPILFVTEAGLAIDLLSLHSGNEAFFARTREPRDCAEAYLGYVAQANPAG
jgi:hypothetical protein